jgi:hypothetical protein
MSLAGLPIDALATRCAEETEKFSRRQPAANEFCFELFRRALAEGVEEAFTRIYQVYERLVLNWVYRNPRFQKTGENAEYFVNSAYSKFYFAVRGPKFERFDTVSALLMYLKLCVQTAIAQYMRDHQKQTPISTDDPDNPIDAPDPQQEKSLGREVDAAELWVVVCRLLPAPEDQVLARLVFTLDMKPAEIMAAYPGRWANEREISVALYRIRRLLRRDPEIRRLLGLRPDDDDETPDS